MKKFIFVCFLFVLLIGCEVYDDTNCEMEVAGTVYKCDSISTDGITYCCNTKEGLVFCTNESYEGYCDAD